MSHKPIEDKLKSKINLVQRCENCSKPVPCKETLTAHNSQETYCLTCYRSLFLTSFFTLIAPTLFGVLWTLIGVGFGHDPSFANHWLADSRATVMTPLSLGMLGLPFYSLYMNLEETKRKTPSRSKLLKAY
jgi:hypothetical protein